MISFKVFTERFFITEAIPLKYAKKKKMSRKFSGAYSDKLDEVFGDKDRLIYPLDINYNESSNHRLLNDIDNLLFRNGYSISSMANYIKGIAYKTTPNGVDLKNPFKIGKLLEKFEPLGLIEVSNRENGRRVRTKIPGKPLLHEFKNDPVRKGSGQYFTVISRHPYDISGASTDRSWTSCMDLGTPRVEYPNKGRNPGSFNRYIARDIEEGSLIAYVVTKDELLPNGKVSLRRPLSRTMIKPHKAPNGLAYTLGQVYGNSYDDFKNFMVDWVSELNKEVTPKDKVYRNRKLYKDMDQPIGFDFRQGSSSADQAMEGIIGFRNEKHLGNEITFTSTDSGNSISYDMIFTYEYKPGFVTAFEELDGITGIWDITQIISKYEKAVATSIVNNLGKNTVSWRINVTEDNNGKDLIVEYHIYFQYSDEYKDNIDDDTLTEIVEDRLQGLMSYDYDRAKKDLERVIFQYDPKQMADEKSKYIQDGLDNFMQPFHNFTAFGTNPKYVNSPLHNLTPITITEFMNMSPEQKDEYIQFLTLCRNDIYSLVSMKDSMMKHGTDPYLKNSQLFRDSVNDKVEEWIMEKYDLDLVDFIDRQNIDWNIFKLRPYFDHAEANKLNDVSDELANIVRNSKYLVGYNKSHRMDQI